MRSHVTRQRGFCCECFGTELAVEVLVAAVAYNHVYMQTTLRVVALRTLRTAVSLASGSAVRLLVLRHVAPSNLLPTQRAAK